MAGHATQVKASLAQVENAAFWQALSSKTIRYQFGMISLRMARRHASASLPVHREAGEGRVAGTWRQKATFITEHHLFQYGSPTRIKRGQRCTGTHPSTLRNPGAQRHPTIVLFTLTNVGSGTLFSLSVSPAGLHCLHAFIAVSKYSSSEHLSCQLDCLV